MFRSHFDQNERQRAIVGQRFQQRMAVDLNAKRRFERLIEHQERVGDRLPGLRLKEDIPGPVRRDFLSWVGEQELPNMRSGSAISAAAIVAGLVAGESLGAFRCGTGAWSGPVKDLRLLRTARWAREGGVSPGDDGAVAAVHLRIGMC